MSATKKGITVRFEDSEMEQLEALAARYHVSSATIIRWALQALTDYVTANGGRITLPLDFSEFFQQAQTTAHNRLRIADSDPPAVAKKNA
jgi:hypothetical protein